MSQTKVTKDLENKTLIIERTFDAPAQKLWRAYADKEWFEQWWGPEGWQTTTKEFTFAPGGRIHYAMKCVDENQGEWFGQESWGLMVIEALDEPHSFSAKYYFIEEDGKTRMVNKSIAQSAEQLEQLVEMGMIEGFSSQLNRLEALLA